MFVKAIRKNLSESNQIKVISYYHFNVNDNTALLLILVSSVGGIRTSNNIQINMVVAVSQY